MSKKKQQEFDFLGQLGSGQEMDLDLNDPKLMAELKQMGWEENDSVEIEDETRKLELEIEAEEQYMEKQNKKYGNKEYTEQDIEKMNLDERDLEDPDLLEELNEIGGAELQAQLMKQELERIESLKTKIENIKQQALAQKRAGNKEKALDFMKEYKSLEVELGNAEKILNVHNIAQKHKAQSPAFDPQPKQKQNPVIESTNMEIEDEEFDYDSIVSMSVLEHEKENFTKKKDKDMVEKFEMAISLLSTNIQAGIIDQEVYMNSLQNKIKEYSAELLNKKGKIASMYNAHIKLMQEELEQASEEGEEEEEEEINPQEKLQNPLQSSTSPALKPLESQSSTTSASKPLDSQRTAPKDSSIPHEELYEHNFNYKTAYDLLDETKQAFAYLKSIGAVTRCEPLLKKAESLHTILKQFQQGQTPQVKFSPIVPQDITGMSEKERRDKIGQQIEFCIKQNAAAKANALTALRQKDQDQAKLFKREMVENEAKAKQLEAALTNP